MSEAEQMRREVGEAQAVRTQTLQAMHELVVDLEFDGKHDAATQVAYAQLLLQRHWLERGWR